MADFDEEIRRQAAISSLLAQQPESQPLDTQTDEQVVAQPEVIKPDTQADYHRLINQAFETKTDEQVTQSDYPATSQDQGVTYPTISEDQDKGPTPRTVVLPAARQVVMPASEEGYSSSAATVAGAPVRQVVMPQGEIAPQDTEDRGERGAPILQTRTDEQVLAPYDENPPATVPDKLSQVERGQEMTEPWHPSPKANVPGFITDSKNAILNPEAGVVPPTPKPAYPDRIVTPEEASGTKSVVNAPAAAPAQTQAPAPAQTQVTQPTSNDDYIKQMDSWFPSAKAADDSGSVGTLEAGADNHVDPKALFGYLQNKFAGSPLIGYVPPDGARWGIKTGSAAEWAAFGLAVAKQESGFNTTSYNASDPGGSAGLFQFGQGQTQFTKGADQFNPQASADAFVRSVEHYVNGGSVADMGETFGSIRRPNEAGQYIPFAQSVAAGAPAQGATAAASNKMPWDDWAKLSPADQAAAEKEGQDFRTQQVSSLDKLNQSTPNPKQFWDKLQQPIEGVTDSQRQAYADNFKQEVTKYAQDFYGEKDPEKAFSRAVSDPGLEAYVSNVGRGLAGAVGQADIGIALAGKSIDRNRVDGFMNLVHPDSTGEGRAGFVKALTDIQDTRHRHDVFNEIYGSLPQNTKDAIGDPASILDSIDHLANPEQQVALNKAIATKKAWVDQQLAGDPQLRGTGADWWTTGTGENLFNTVAALVPGGVGAVVRTTTLGSQMYSANMDRIAKEHPDYSPEQVSEEASKSAFMTLAPQEAVLAASHGLTAPLLKWAGSLAEKPIVRFGIGGGVQVAAAGAGGALGQVGANVAENKPLLENVPQAAGSAVVQSLPFAVHGGLHGVAEGPPVKPEPAPPPPEPPPPRPTQTSGLENAPEPMPEVTLRPGQQVRTSEILGREPGEPRGVIRGDILGPEETGTPPMGERWYDPGPITTRPVERAAFSPQELQQAVAKLSDAGMSPDQIHQVISQLRPGLEQNLQSVHLGAEGDLEAARTQQIQTNAPEPASARAQAKPPVDLAEAIRQQKAAAGLGGAPAPQESSARPLGGAPGEPPPRLGSADAMTGNAGVEEPWESRIANKYVKERIVAGEIGEVEPGTGKTTAELLAHGLTMGPEKINQHMSDIMQGKGDPVEQTAAMRAEEARLSHRSHEASLIAEADPNNSAKQIAADNALKDLTDLYNGPMKKLKQNWHRQGVAFQDRIPIDLSTYNGIRAEFIKSTGKTEVPAQAEAGMRKSAAQVRAAGDNLKARMQKLGSEAEKNGANRKLPSIDKVAEDVMGVMKHDPCPV